MSFEQLYISLLLKNIYKNVFKIFFKGRKTSAFGLQDIYPTRSIYLFLLLSRCILIAVTLMALISDFCWTSSLKKIKTFASADINVAYYLFKFSTDSQISF